MSPFYPDECRPHQGIGNCLMRAADGDELPAVVSVDHIRCETRLGGLLKHYRRTA